MRLSGQRRIVPLADIGKEILKVEKPSRYLGGETGSIVKYDDSLLSVAICFPDLYEIGMSNNAIKILYSGLNALSNVKAERVFAPAPDFESLLQQRGIPLYTLETGMALSDVDVLGFSLGFELSATNVITVLKAGHIPVRASERRQGDPIVMAGGPASTNPHPLAIFLDAVYIGEAEDGFFVLVSEMARLKSSGAGRNDILGCLRQSDAVWLPKRGDIPGKRANRAVFSGFNSTAATTALPLPTVLTVQNHGTVEIMRGCSNGCRFCHAGYFYRPQRIKPYEIIHSEVKSLVELGGYSEITLASLSSGDYPNIGGLLDRLNAEWGSERVSFQLPSLKINSFTLPIVRKLAEVRKSGLTFAIETPVDDWQRSINKDVSFEKIVAILKEAKDAGFKQAKFYFMIGLPVPGMGLGEAEAILEFFARLRNIIALQINVNVGTFVPKPHTPFQWSPQLLENEALATINSIRSGLRHYNNIKVSYHSPFSSQLEGIIARGDERVGELILAAHEKGARLDAWEEHFDRELWRTVISEAAWPVIDECCGSKLLTSPLAWDDIGLRVSKQYLWHEFEYSRAMKPTPVCIENCDTPCGSCNEATKIYSITRDEINNTSNAPVKIISPKPVGRLVFRYLKTASAAYMQHLSVIDAFERTILMSGLKVHYSEGYNPKPRFETSQPIPIAVESRCEIASLLLCEKVDANICIELLTSRLPQGLSIAEAVLFPPVEGQKQRSIGIFAWAADYQIS